MGEAHAAVRRAVAARRIAETEAKKRLAVQAIKLHKWIASHIALRKSAMAASVRARIAAQVAHTQHMTGLRLRIRESRVQIKALHLVIKGKLTMKKVHSLRKAAFGLERRARGQHNYVWSPRKSTCKDKCMKYKDWLKVVTALAKAMAMKPCGKVPGAPMNGVKYITHNKSVKIVHGNKMVLTHHITYHVCKA